MNRGALHDLTQIEMPSRGVAMQAAMAEMIERAGLEVGDQLLPEGTIPRHRALA